MSSRLTLRTGTMSCRLTLLMLALLAVAAVQCWQHIQEGQCIYQGLIYDDGDTFTEHDPCSQGKCIQGAIGFVACPPMESCEEGQSPIIDLGNPAANYPECCGQLVECV